MAGEVRNVSKSEVDERLSALLNNASAIRAVASAVEGTIGPKGLNCMLVDRFGDVVITNDGATILSKIEVNHPAGKMLINAAKAQDEEVGDGTTTVTLIASTLISEGVNQVLRGVPVAKVIEGIKVGVKRAISLLEEHSRPVEDFSSPLLFRAAYIAGRGNEDIASIAVEAARIMGKEKLLDPSFKLKDMVVAKEGANNEVFLGLIIEKERMNRQMPRRVDKALVLVVDDALEPEEIEDDALATESGFREYQRLREEFRKGIEKIISLGVKFVAVSKGVDRLAEEMLTDAGVMVLRRLSNKDITKIAEHTGAKPIKRTSLMKSREELQGFLGYAETIYNDEKLENTRIMGGKGKPVATILVGAATEEVKEERERIAKDAAAAVQMAIKGGVLPGGGAIELYAIKEVQRAREEIKGMAVYGIDCVIEALKKPLTQIVLNAGFNPLEKIGDVLARQSKEDNDALAIDCDTGEVADMMELGVVDPTPVKVFALKTAGELAEAILSINMIIKKREEIPSEEKKTTQRKEDEL
ncbi:MAG: TCP-1/cpn60 chaperonin family protein [bacterium]